MNLFNSSRRVALAVTALTILGLGLPAFAAPPLPFKGRANVVVTGQEPLPPFPPTSVRLTGSATGQATYLGRFTRTETITLNLQTGTFTGTLEFTAANGDKLTAGISGQFTPDLSAADGTYVFTGGRGRFQNATGRATFEAKADGAGGFDVKFNGTIQY